MTEFRDTERDLNHFRVRMNAAAALVLVCFAILLLRLVWLQAVRHSHYSSVAEDNRIAVSPVVPNRGLIIDRNGVVLAQNYSAYTLEISPSKVAGELDQVIDELAKLVDIQPRDRKRFRKMLEESKSFETLPIRTLLSDEEVARFSAQRFRFPGVEIRARLFRQYPLGESASHVIGYIGRMSQADKDKLEALSDANNNAQAGYDARLSATNYRGTEYVGKIGIEQSYETELHGITGFEEVEVSAGGRAVRTLSTTAATPGNNLLLSLDARLQWMVEKLYGDRRGALVAIQPSTGDVLAFVSMPTFDPNLFVEGIDPDTWRMLNESSDRPLYNRPLKGVYPPGSTYKPFMALAALSTGERTPQQTISDPGYFMFGNHQFRDDKPGGHGTVDMAKSIIESCDTYYYILARDLGVNVIHDFMKPLGFGQITGIDINGEARGVLPSTEWKQRTYRKPEQQKWYPGETISLGIGQGYNSFTILQLAHAVSTLANGGVVMKPHLVKAVEDSVTRKRALTVPKESYRIALKPEHIDVIRKAMIEVNRTGTGAAAFRGADYVAAGKTGTAQVFTVAQNARTDSRQAKEHLRDHALYIAFAPADNPRIALALVVENSGFGAQFAAPIARRVFDYVLEGKWPDDVPPLPTPNAPVAAAANAAASSVVAAANVGAAGGRAPAAVPATAPANPAAPTAGPAAGPTTGPTTGPAASATAAPTAARPASPAPTPAPAPTPTQPAAASAPAALNKERR